MKVDVICRSCKVKHIIDCPPADWLKWMMGMPIQHAMPYLPAEIREMLISETCEDCWKKIMSSAGQHHETKFDNP